MPISGRDIQGIITHTCNPCPQEAEKRRIVVSQRPAWSTWVPDPARATESLCLQKDKNKMWKEQKILEWLVAPNSGLVHPHPSGCLVLRCPEPCLPQCFPRVESSDSCGPAQHVVRKFFTLYCTLTPSLSDYAKRESLCLMLISHFFLPKVWALAI